MAQRGRPRKYPKVEAIHAPSPTPTIDEQITEPAGPQIPADWHPGQLLNVRNTGPDYTITLWPEEADPRKPERALHFTNPGEAQNFVSQWYSRQSHDPRAC